MKSGVSAKWMMARQLALKQDVCSVKGLKDIS